MYEAILVLVNLLFRTCGESFQGIGVVVAMAIIVQLAHVERKNRMANRARNREYALTEMTEMSESHFKRMFRMSKPTFDILVEKLFDLLGEEPFDELQAARSSGSHTSIRTRLACTLRWLAGGSYIDICFEFGVAPGSFFVDGGVLWGTMHCLNDLFDIGLPVHDEGQLRRMADEFKYWSKNTMTNCVLAIDGWVCRTRCPTKKEVELPMSYRNRHGCFGIVVLAGCDARFAESCSIIR